MKSTTATKYRWPVFKTYGQIYKENIKLPEDVDVEINVYLDKKLTQKITVCQRKTHVHNSRHMLLLQMKRVMKIRKKTCKHKHEQKNKEYHRESTGHACTEKI